MLRVLQSCTLVMVAWLTPTITCAEPVEVKDYLGRTVTFSRPVQRVVALAPHIVENFYSAGAGHTLVAAVEYSDFPEPAKQLPRVGAVSSFSLETIASLNPDLVVVWMSTRGGDILQQLEAIGIKTYASDPHSLEDVARSILDYGVLAGTQAIAQHTVDEYRAQLQDLRQRYQQKSLISAFYEVWLEPLQTLNGEHIVSDVMRLCGVRNVFAGERLLAPNVSMEALLARQPQMILSGSANANPEAWRKRWQQWPTIPAVALGHLVAIPGDWIHRHSTRILKGARIICESAEQTRSDGRGLQ